MAEPEATPTTALTEGGQQPTTDPGTNGAYPVMDWRNLPDLTELRADPQFNKTLEVYPSMANFVKDAVGWRSEVSRRVRVPNPETAKPEDWQKFWQQVPGYPKSPAEYEGAVTLPVLGTQEDGTPVPWDKDLLAGFFETSHAAGLTTQQAQAVLDTYARSLEQSKHVVEAQAAQEQVNHELELQKRFGASLPRKVSAARNYFMRTTRNTELGDRIWNKAVEQGWGNDPDIIEFFSLQYERFGEPMDLLSDNLFPVTPTVEEMTSEKGKLLEVVNDRKKPASERDAAFKKLERLNTQMAGMTAGRR